MQVEFLDECSTSDGTVVSDSFIAEPHRMYPGQLNGVRAPTMVSKKRAIACAQERAAKAYHCMDRMPLSGVANSSQ